MSALEERRQRAREAGQDVMPPGNHERAVRAMETAIETATRVQLTGEIKQAVIVSSGYGYDIPGDAYDRMIVACLRSAGFEVES